MTDFAPPVRNRKTVFIVERNSVGIANVMLIVFYRRLGIHM